MLRLFKLRWKNNSVGETSTNEERNVTLGRRMMNMRIKRTGNYNKLFKKYIAIKTRFDVFTTRAFLWCSIRHKHRIAVCIILGGGFSLNRESVVLRPLMCGVLTKQSVFRVWRNWATVSRNLGTIISRTTFLTLLLVTLRYHFKSLLCVLRTCEGWQMLAC